MFEFHASLDRPEAEGENLMRMEAQLISKRFFELEAYHVGSSQLSILCEIQTSHMASVIAI